MKTWPVRPVAKWAHARAKKTHSKTLGRAHSHLTGRWKWYKNWHQWRYHHHVHHIALGLYILLIGVFGFGFFRSALAADLTHIWDFTVGGDYSKSSGAEVASNTGRLKVQNYTSDANTMALYHLDENTGSSAGDSSSNANTGTITGGAWQTGSLNYSLTLDGSSTYISAADSASLSLTGSNTIEAWTKFGSSFSANSHDNRQFIADKGVYQLYYDNQTGKVTYELERSGQTGWALQAGGKSSGGQVKNSWDRDGKNQISAQAAIGSDLYAAVGSVIGGGTTHSGDAEVWKWNGTIWSQVGGKGVNGSWADDVYENVYSLVASGNYLYAGLGSGTGDGEVWRYNSTNSTWTKVAGDGINGSFTDSVVYSLEVTGSTVYAGTGDTLGAVYKCTSCETSPSWTQVGGGSMNGSWSLPRVTALKLVGSSLVAATGPNATHGTLYTMDTGTGTWTKRGGGGSGAGGQSWGTGYEVGFSLTAVGNVIYAGFGNSTTDADVWKCDLSGTCTVTAGWTQIGGDGLNSSWNTNYESVRSLTADGSGNIYAGIGDTSGDNEIWKYNGSTWSQIGGDSLNSSWSTANTQITSLIIVGTNLYAGDGSQAAAASGDLWKTDLTSISWSRIGGQYINNSWGYTGIDAVVSSTQDGTYLYAGTGTAAGDAQVWRFDGTSWLLIGGQGVNSSWAFNSYENVSSLTTFNGNLYAGLGSGANDAEVWKWSGSSWTQVGGDSLNSGWTTNYESVESLASVNGKLYAGLGTTAGDAEVWEYDSSTWTKIGGDSLNSSWNSSNQSVTNMLSFEDKLTVAVGVSAGTVWQWSGSSWTRIGGGGTGIGGQSWGTSDVNRAQSLAVYRDKLYVGLGSGTALSDVWVCSSGCSDTSGWSQIGGDGLNSSWTEQTTVYSLAVYNGRLYASLSGATGKGEVWEYDDSAWTQVAATGISGWPINMESAYALSVYHGKLYVGTGDSSVSDGFVLSFGNNSYLQSTSTSQDTAWHHIAATYDGTTMKLYRDGALDGTLAVSLGLADNSQPLYIGASLGSRESGRGQSFFSGSIDELRISNIARTSFNTTPYSASNETVQPTVAVYSNGVAQWDSFADSETLNSGTINYRLSYDGGSTWKYWDGAAWATSNTLTNANSVSVINSHITVFPVTSGGLLWQAILKGNGNQLVTLNSVTVTATSDTTAPNNPSTASGLDSFGGSTSLTSGGWYNYSAPYFTWTPPSDPPSPSGGTSGVSGYYVYFGTDNTADPLTAGTFQTNSNYTAGSLASGSTYYLRIRTKDTAGNLTSATSDLFTYQFDSTAPATIEYVNVSPAGCSTTPTYTFTWPASSDGQSGVASYDYRLGSSGVVQNINALTIDAPPYQVGDNVFYVRAKDTAGNTSAWQTGIYCSTANATIVDGPTVTAGAGSILVTWVSSKATSSFVRVQDGNDYVSEQGQSEYTISHSVKVVGLEPEKAYQYKLIWSDSSGNLGQSTLFSTTTATAPALKNLTTKVLGPSNVLISWDTTSLSSSALKYGVGNYSNEISENGLATHFAEQLTGLKAGSAYQARVDARTQDGYPYFGIVTFQTPPFPLISNLRFDYMPDAQATVKVTWDTNVPSNSLVRYSTNRGSTKVASSAEMTTNHSITIVGLLDDTAYSFQAQSTDEFGNTGTSDSQNYSTPFDTRAPKIISLSVALKSTGVGSSQQAQIVVSWQTDEVATTQVEYGPGLSSISYPSKTSEDGVLSTSHVAIISNLEPAKIYHLRAVSKDRSGNRVNSVDTTAITGKAQNSVLDLIINALQNSLHFLTNFPFIGSKQ